MTKEEAKLVLDNARPQTKEIDRQFYDDEDLNNALDMAIKALEQQTSDDCVSRTQAIEWIENLRQMDKCFGNYEDDYFPLSEVIDRLKNVPPVTPTFPKGATNGNMIKAMFPDCEDWKAKIEDNDGEVYEVHFVQLPNSMTVNKHDESWWNAPYKRGSENE